MEFVRYKTSSPAGDLISFLPGIGQVYKETGKAGILFQRLDMVGGGHTGSIHPFANEFEEPVCMPRQMFDMLKPLLLAQDYIKDFIVFEGQEIDVDLDKIRMEVFTNQPKGNLRNWPEFAFPQMAHNLSEKSLCVPIEIKYADKVLCNFTQRYRNSVVNYFFLKKHQNQLLFAGLEEEHSYFCKQWGLEIELLKVSDFLELASAIEGCKFVLANQSMVFQIAESLKVPRVLEVFPIMPNVIPVGEKAYMFYHQGHLEYLFNKLIAG